MRPVFRLVALILLVCLIGSGRAEAGIWDWLEELNGPGPSTSKHGPAIMANLYCSEAKSRSKPEGSSAGIKVLNRAFQIPDAPGEGTCIFWDYHSFRAEDDSRFYPVDISTWEIGTSTRLHPSLEIGAGFGKINFSSRNTDDATAPEISGSRYTVSFPRVAFKPLLAVPAASFQSKPGLGFFQVYFKYTIVVGDLTNEHFASKPDNVFSRTNQRVESVGFVIDASSVLDLFTRH